MSTPDPRNSADEVNALLTTLTQWAQRAMPAPPSGRPGPECQWCPLCQLASALRGEHPELTDRLAEAGAAVAGAVRALTDSGAWPASTEAPPADGPASEPAGEPSTQVPEATQPKRARPRPRIERIELDDPPGHG